MLLKKKHCKKFFQKILHFFQKASFIKGCNLPGKRLSKVGFAKKFYRKFRIKKGGLLAHHNLLYTIINITFRYIRNV